ncbi:MAG TPA: zf-HC2 domain-containing protein [Bryobacteraceae bacterium]|nr:zf-HC2 domain-containing protein [Bryobacteraceae bacterium]
MITKSGAHTDLLLDYTAGRLDDDERIRLERHMEECPACASFRMEQAAVWEALDLWEPAPVSMDFNRRLWQRIESAVATPWYRSLAESLRFANWKPLIPLTAAVLVIAAGFVFDHPARRTAVSGMTIREADQVEQTLDDIDLLHQLDAVVLPASGGSKTM